MSSEDLLQVLNSSKLSMNIFEHWEPKHVETTSVGNAFNQLLKNKKTV